jgi:hypothetical protein
MRFFSIAVTVFALAAQVALTSATHTTYDKLSCKDEVDPCMEVAIASTNQCNGDTVTYCLQPKIGADPSMCWPNGQAVEYDHAVVYVDGYHVNLETSALPSASCIGMDPDPDTCTKYEGDSCKLLDVFQAGYGNTNKGLRCKDTTQGLCVTVPILNVNGDHAKVVFGLKDDRGCQDPHGGWTCSAAGYHSCACHGSKSACLWETMDNCDPPTLPPTLPPSTLPPPTLPPPPPTGGVGANGDPHFKTWRGQHFDYHGECDLVLLHSSEFGSGLGLDVHIRTKLRRDMAYISGATVRIGKDILEVDSQGVYYFNRKVGAAMPDEFSGFTFSHTQPTDKQHLFEVDLGGGEKINVKTYKDFVSILIEEGQHQNFGDSVGLMGDFEQGRMIARDGTTVFDDANDFGQEWQVRDTEPTLFHTDRLPQHPMECTMPTPMQASQLRRRLAETSSADELAAEKACDHWGEGKDDCVFDVLATGDLEMALAGAY